MQTKILDLGIELGGVARPCYRVRTMRRAVIDIGTNSVKLLVAEVEGSSVLPVWEESEQTRLGRGFYETHVLRPEAIAATAQAAGQFVMTALRWDAASVRIIATSAARDARNQADLLAAVRRAAGHPVEVISGEQEADWAFAGVRSDARLAHHSLLILDIGGGSTEFIVGHGERQCFRHSFRLGAVRLLERAKVSDPPRSDQWQQCWDSIQEVLRRDVGPLLIPHVAGPDCHGLLLVGTGGTPSMLAAMELGLTSFHRDKIEQAVLSRTRVQTWRERLWSISLRERQSIAGLPSNRADVILFGVAIVEGVMDAFAFRELRVSTRGLRFGALAAAAF